MVVSITAFRDVASGETLLDSVSSIDATADAVTNLYTVPAGQTVVVTKVVLRVTAIDTLTVNPVGGVGIAAGEEDIFLPQTITGLTAVGDTWTFDAQAKAVDASATEIIKLGFDTLATATTLTLAADIFGYFVGTANVVEAPVWTAWTPTGSWTTNSTYSGVYRVYGDSIECRVLITMSGAPNAVGLTLNLPPGFTVDTAKLPGSTFFWPVGTCNLHDNGTNVYDGEVTYDDSAGTINVIQRFVLGSLIRANHLGGDIVGPTTPFTWASGDEMYAYFSLPIVV